MTTNGSSESADPLVGQILPGGLRVLAREGSTSDGPLYRAQYLQNGPPVALMVLRLPAGPGTLPVGVLSARPPLADRRWQQLQRACQIRHPNVAGLLEVKEAPGGVVYATGELLSGDLLADVLSTHGSLPQHQAVDVCLQAAAGIEAAHRVGVAHGSISPHTILVTADASDRPFVKLVRFDFSCYERDGGRASLRPGDRPYASPERLAGGEPDPLDDVFSLGAILHLLTIGSPPGDDAPRRAIPRGLRRVIDRALAPRESRYPTVAEFSEALSRAPLSTADERRGSFGRQTWVAVSAIVVVAGLWFGRDRISELSAGEPEEVAVRPAASAADPPGSGARHAETTAPATVRRVEPRPIPAAAAVRISGPPSNGQKADSTHRSGSLVLAPRDVATGAALSPFRRSHPWAAHPDGRVYFRSSCTLALGSSDLLYFKSDAEARATGRSRSTTPGCF